MKTWGGLKWNDANFACKYDKSIALNMDIDNFFQKTIWMRKTRYEQIAWLMFSIIKNEHLLFCHQISLDQNLMLWKQNKT
jgi:hypothetical protein